MSGTGIIIAAPASGAGKTTLTLGILRALRQAGVAVRSAKSGPDYIDPRFHEAATGAPCVNLDAWAMTEADIRALAAGDGLLVVEGAMGLFDGAPPDGTGATADLASALGLPVVLVLDASKQGQSVAAVVEGFARHRAGVAVAGVILNRIGSRRHESLLRQALDGTGIPVLGALARRDDLSLPSRHLGLVQAAEHGGLAAFLDRAAQAVAGSLDLDLLRSLATPLPGGDAKPCLLPPPAQRIAVAQDEAFAFSYPHLLHGWRAAGAELSFFSPLADQAPDASAAFVFLPGGYPELHAARLAAASRFAAGMKSATDAGAEIYGECGGYMVLGEGLTDGDGVRHRMLGLLALETSFAERKLHLGYRTLAPLGGPWAAPLMAHEFHYATTLRETGDALFHASDAAGKALGPTGLRNGRVSGSFQHVICTARGG